jgi:hypothetical protein
MHGYALQESASWCSSCYLGVGWTGDQADGKTAPVPAAGGRMQIHLGSSGAPSHVSSLWADRVQDTLAKWANGDADDPGRCHDPDSRAPKILKRVEQVHLPYLIQIACPS